MDEWLAGNGDWWGWIDDQWQCIRDWLLAHDVQIDIVTVWAFAAGFGILALVELTTWLVMWGSEDRTPVGRALRPKKLGYFLIFSAMSTLYSLTLLAYYGKISVSFWDRIGVRLLGMIGIVAAVVAGVVFVALLIRDRLAERRRARPARPP